MIFSASDVPRKGVQIFFGHQKQWNPPYGFGLPRVLKCSFTGHSTLVLQTLSLVQSCERFLISLH